MKKKAIKIAASTAVAASAFVAAAPANQADAATNVNQLATDAQNAGTVLKWAISVEGSADYKTRPYDQYNAAKKAVAAAEAAAAKLSSTEKLSIQAKLVEPKIQITRAQAYIDAITSSEKIIGLTNNLDAAIKSGDLGKVETAYHTATAEYRKQAKLLDRVYGQSTRDGIRNAVKPTLEKLIADVQYDVTVKTHLDKASALIKNNKLEEAAAELAKADYNLTLKDAKFTFKSTLEKNYTDVAAALPLQVLSVDRVNDNTVTVKFSKQVDAVLPAGQFVFDNSLTVNAAVVSEDRKTVTLTTSTQKVGTTYTLSYQGKATGKSFTTPGAVTDNTFFVDQADVERIEVGQTRVYKVTVKNADLTNYNGQVKINTNAGATADLVSVNGVATSGDTATVTVPYDGILTIVIKGDAGSADGFVPTVERVDNEKVLKLGRTFVYQPAADNATLSATEFTGFHDKTNNYFTVGATKYKYDANDVFHILGNVVTLDQFKAALSYKDTFTVTSYKAAASGSSVFNITSDVTFAGVEFTNPEVKVTYDGYGMNYKFEGEGNNGYTVYLYNNVTGGLVGTSTVSSGKWSVQAANLGTPGQNPTFTAVQVAPGQSVDAAKTISENVAVSAEVLVGPYEVNSVSTAGSIADGVIGFGDVLNFTFSYFSNDSLNDLKVSSSATITLKDSLSKKATYKVVKVDRDTLKIVDVVSSEAGYDNKETTSHRIDSVSGVTNQDNLVLKVKEGIGFNQGVVNPPLTQEQIKVIAADTAVTKAEGSKTQADKDAAQSAVNALAAGATKDALQARVNAIQVGAVKVTLGDVTSTITNNGLGNKVVGFNTADLADANKGTSYSLVLDGNTYNFVVNPFTAGRYTVSVPSTYTDAQINAAEFKVVK
ncbi:hypothetical protein ACIQYS_12760 [Psychrobacillus sp. NPDC096426]|uniref:hypothetical protein n=1 Tax=Psychrobacillus sp. NPDC096426 TaxID=3364491 RepID=UPI0038225693